MSFVNEISPKSSILECLKKMDEIGKKLLVLTDGDTFVNVLSIGDIQRAIINNVDLSTEVFQITREIITVAKEEETLDQIKTKMITLRTECMPIVSSTGKLIDVVFWEDLFEDSRSEYRSINCPVVIMAGGQGVRLKPFTNVLPKPLMPFGNVTMIESIIDSFIKHSCNEFHLSVTYKAELIKFYLADKYSDDTRINYFQEDIPLGTAGSLFLLKDQIQ